MQGNPNNLPPPARPQAAPPKVTKGPQIEYVLIAAGWIPIMPGSLMFAPAKDVAPMFPHDDETLPWFVCVENGGRQIMGPASTIQAVKYSKE